MNFPRFTGADFKIMFGILIPYVILLNSLLFGARLYASPFVFLVVLLISLTIKSISWQFHTLVAVTLRNAMPGDAQIMKRIGTALSCFFVMTALVISLITFIYRGTGLFGFQFRIENYCWALVSGVVLNIFTTLVYEGTSNFEKWKLTLTETEQLKTEHVKSQLQGLKSQIRPHFLFNSINTLSALISEEPERAERFLDEMCRVFRYLLRDHGRFISLKREIEFLRSYFYILNARYGEGINVRIDADEPDLSMQIPPFTLQLLIEDIIHCNIISRSKPLVILIRAQDGQLAISNSNSPKTGSAFRSDDLTIHNILNKFRLLNLTEPVVADQTTFREILIPLVQDPGFEADE